MAVVPWLALAGCARPERVHPVDEPPAGPPPDSPATPPQLVVLVVVDQLPQRLLDRVRPLLTGGIARLAGDQAFRAVGRYPYAATFTCPGHATIATGAAPSVHGIVSNVWYDAAAARAVYCGDPALLRVDGIADAVTDGGGRAVALALKDRSALMLGGHHPTGAVWFDEQAGRFTAPLGEFPIAPYLDDPWEASFPEDYQRIAGPDADPNEEDPGIGTVFPHPPASTAPGAFLATPFAGSALTDAALDLVDRFALGTDSEPDLLAVSYSQIDYIGHTFTTESWEALDGLVRLDRDLERLFGGLDAKVGAGRYTLVLSSDHGSIEPGPVRVSKAELVRAATEAAATVGLGPPVYFDPTVYLPSTSDPAVRGQAAAAVAAALRQVPGISDAVPWRTASFTAPVDPVWEAVRLSVDEERSGDVYVVPAEHVVIDYPGSEGKGTTHGTPWPDDQRVPLLAIGAGIAPGAATDEVDMRRIARTLADLMGVPLPPSASPAIEGALAR